MKLTLTRWPSHKGATLGQLAIDGKHQCYTCEDEVREPGVKVYGKTAIPPGTYRVQITMSPRFKRRLPLLLDVPGFDGIRIHVGNTPEDTEGCILPGRGHTDATVTQSVLAFDALMVRLEAAQAAKEPVWIEIRPAAINRAVGAVADAPQGAEG